MLGKKLTKEYFGGFLGYREILAGLNLSNSFKSFIFLLVSYSHSTTNLRAFYVNLFEIILISTAMCTTYVNEWVNYLFRSYRTVTWALA